MSTQYQSLAAPLFTTGDPPPEDKDWNRTQPDLPVRRPWSAALTVACCVVPFVTSQPYETYGWQRQQPDPVRRTGIITALQQDALVRNPITGLADPPRAGGTSGWIATGSVPIIQYQALAGPILVAVEGPAASVYAPSKVWPARALHASQHPAWFFDVQWEAPAAATVTENSWQGYQPDRIPPPRGTAAHRQPSFTSDIGITPGAAPAPEASWYPRYVDRHSYARALAPYTWGQQHFAFLQLVPVMSWTGMYLDPPVLRKSSHAILMGGSRWPVGIEGTPPPTELTWQGSQPSKIDPKAWSIAAQEAKASAPVFVPDVTVIPPASSWRSIHPDQIWPRLALFVGHHPAFVFDAQWEAPAAVTAPGLAVAVYPDRVPGNPPLRQQAWLVVPAFVADVTDPPPIRSWAPRYPDWIARLQLATANHPAWTEPIFIPGITVVPPAHSWDAFYPDRIPALRVWRAADAPALAMDANFLALLPADPTHAIVNDGDLLLFRTDDGTVLLFRVDDGTVRWD